MVKVYVPTCLTDVTLASYRPKSLLTLLSTTNWPNSVQSQDARMS